MGHRMTSQINQVERCVDVMCFDCRFRASAENIDQAARAMIAHINDTRTGG